MDRAATGSDRIAVFAGLFAGLCWGVYWLPLRIVEQGGVEAAWAMALFTGVPAILSLPAIWFLRLDYARGGRALLGGILGGVAFALYAASLLYTEVVRAILLFYLMPIWGFLLGWVFLGDRMTWSRWLAIGLGIVGMTVIFAQDTGIPWPRNAGDWCGLVSGMFWALGCTLILTGGGRVRAATHTVNFFVVAAIVSLVVALMGTAQGRVVPPEAGDIGKVLIWFLPITILLILPSGFATIFAPTRLNPGVVGFLFMTEVVVAAVSAAIWSGERFGIREMIGLPLIMSAGLIEPVLMTWRGRRAQVEGTA